MPRKDSDSLETLLKKAAFHRDDTRYLVIDEKRAFELAEKLNIRLKDVYLGALEAGITPLRYLRNREALSLSDQVTLLRSSVAVIGAGGLGGHVTHLLSRLGVGSILLFDPDHFDETNLNRQLYATSETIGKPKAEVIRQLMETVNPSVEIVPFVCRMSPEKTEEIASANLIVDALDNTDDRRMLAGVAENLNIPMVHGAVAGFEGRVFTHYRGGTGLSAILNGGGGIPAETKMGTPAVSPCLIGTLQVMEAIKILLNKKKTLKETMLHVDLENLFFERFKF